MAVRIVYRRVLTINLTAVCIGGTATSLEAARGEPERLFTAKLEIYAQSLVTTGKERLLTAVTNAGTHLG